MQSNLLIYLRPRMFLTLPMGLKCAFSFLSLFYYDLPCLFFSCETLKKHVLYYVCYYELYSISKINFLFLHPTYSHSNDARYIQMEFLFLANIALKACAHESFRYGLKRQGSDRANIFFSCLKKGFFRYHRIAFSNSE